MLASRREPDSKEIGLTGEVHKGLWNGPLFSLGEIFSVSLVSLDPGGPTRVILSRTALTRHWRATLSQRGRGYELPRYRRACLREQLRLRGGHRVAALRFVPGA